MQLPPFWRRCGTHGPARSRIALFRAVLRSAQSVEGYRDRLRAAGLHREDCVEKVDDVERALSTLPPMPFPNYDSLFPDRVPACVRAPLDDESRSAYLLPYAEARRGLDNYRRPADRVVDLYSPQALAGATRDLYNLGRAIRSSSPIDPDTDHGVVTFSGLDAGLITEAQRESLWNQCQVPLFEHFLGTDGRVVATECEVHAGLHIRQQNAVFELIDGELAFTSLSDEQFPALRVLSGFNCSIERETCECGRSEPRLTQLRSLRAPALIAAA